MKYILLVALIMLSACSSAVRNPLVEAKKEELQILIDKAEKETKRSLEDLKKLQEFYAKEIDRVAQIDVD